MLEEDFYAALDIAPICLLADCMYHNECKHGISWGDDACEYLEEGDPLSEDNPCDTCPKGEEKHLYYPPITDDIIVNLILICGTDNISLNSYCADDEDKEIILKDVLQVCKNSFGIKTKVRDILIGQLQEYGRM